MPSSPPLRRTLMLSLAALALSPHAVAAEARARRRRATHARHKAAARAEPTSGPAYGRSDKVRRLAAGLAARFALDPDWTEAAIAQARHVEAVTRLIMPPPKGQPKNWAAYRARFIEPERIAAGVAFWAANEKWLNAGEYVFGVSPEAVIGILGVETFYGRVMGNFRVLDALATLSLDFPSGRSDRSAFFQEQLGEYLVWVKREGREPDSVKGSYAGAMGLGQFMPGSLNHFAFDLDGDGRIDLHGSPADAIGSVARYLKIHGWLEGDPTHFPVEPPADPAARARLLEPDILPTFTPAQFTEAGAVLPDDARAFDGPLALVQLDNGGAAPSFVAGTVNFYAITRYNQSAYYAMAVAELGKAVAAARAAAGR